MSVPIRSPGRTTRGSTRSCSPDGDTRNVVDRYRYWTVPAIVADLDQRRHALHVAIQNWEHDFNIGSIVRTANAFNVGGVHIIGRRRWNRRGAMVTDRYLTVRHHPDVDDFAGWLTDSGYAAVGVDNLPGAVPLETTELPELCLPGVRLRRAGADPGARGPLPAAGRDHPVRVDPVAQRRCRRGHRHVPLGPALGIARPMRRWSLWSETSDQPHTGIHWSADTVISQEEETE